MRLAAATWLLSHPSRLSWVLIELWGRPSIDWRQRLANARWQIKHYGDNEAFHNLWVTWRESNQDRIPGISVDLRTRFRRRADRRARRLNASRTIPSYRWDVVREDGRWAVVAFQNYARSVA